MTRDIFEEPQRLVGCDYISDLQTEPYRTEARQPAGKMDLEPYELRALSDLAEYLYGKKPQFETHEQARHFFRAGQS